MAPKKNLFAVGASMLINKARVIGVEGEFLPGVFALPLPGHTYDSHGIAFMHRGKKLLIAGDSVVSRHHFDYLDNNFEDDKEAAVQTQKMIKEQLYAVIPRHDIILI